jgi:hypothetical protein
MSNNITMIENLPELEDNNNQEPVTNYNKFIRNSYRPNADSGMLSDNNISERQDQPPVQQIITESFTPSSAVNPLSYHCIDIANHVENCPICSQIYKNDKTIYIIIIIFLVIICILLLKKVLNL